jgi:hypothetical protein
MPNCAVSVIPSNPTHPIPSEKRILRLPSTGNFQVSVSRSTKLLNETSTVGIGVVLFGSGSVYSKRALDDTLPVSGPPGSVRVPSALLSISWLRLEGQFPGG